MKQTKMVTAHLADRACPDLTACGAPWEPWQDPFSQRPRPASQGTPNLAERGQVQQCQACLRAARPPEKAFEIGRRIWLVMRSQSYAVRTRW